MLSGLFLFKVISLFGLLFFTVVSSLLPLHLQRSHSISTERRERILARFSFFTGGVFLGAGLLHMLPDAVHDMQEAQQQLAATQLQAQPQDEDEHGLAHFPLVFLAAALGFIMIWAVDKLNMGSHDANVPVKNATMIAVAAGASATEQGASICVVSVDPVTTYGSKATQEENQDQENKHHHHHHHHHRQHSQVAQPRPPDRSRSHSHSQAYNHLTEEAAKSHSDETTSLLSDRDSKVVLGVSSYSPVTRSSSSSCYGAAAGNSYVHGHCTHKKSLEDTRPKAHCSEDIFVHNSTSNNGHPSNSHGVAPSTCATTNCCTVSTTTPSEAMPALTLTNDPAAPSHSKNAYQAASSLDSLLAFNHSYQSDHSLSSIHSDHQHKHHHTHARSHHHSHAHAHDSPHSHEHGHSHQDHPTPTPDHGHSHSHSHSHGHGHSHGSGSHGSHGHSHGLSSLLSAFQTTPNTATTSSSSSSSSHPPALLSDEDDKSEWHDHEHQQVHHHHIHISGSSKLLPIILAVVFSIHSFIEGLALGIQSSLNSSCISLIIAISSHKIIEAITVGSNFVKENVQVSTAIPVILVYCLMTPLGILCGMITEDVLTGVHAIITQSLLQAFAAGSFLYLTIHEVSDETCCQHVSSWQQIGLMLLGLSTMAALAIFA